MDSQVWRTIYQTVLDVNRQLPRCGRTPRYPDSLIVAMYLWSVLHDRPLCWASQRSHYTTLFRPRRLPSNSQFCRRLKTDRVLRVLNEVHKQLAGHGLAPELSFLDGRALRVGAHSKDPDARKGRVSGGFARGYRLHAWGTQDQRIPLWSVMPLNWDERVVAMELAQWAPQSPLVLADAYYDSGPLYDRLAERGSHLLTPMRKKNAGRGHRKYSPVRLAAIHAWNGVAGYVYRERGEIERQFGHQVWTAGGLGPLPGWVRRLPRVRMWVGAKLIFHHARLFVRRSIA
jgi:IS5 family transposase